VIYRTAIIVVFVVVATISVSLHGFDHASAQPIYCSLEQGRACQDKFVTEGWKRRFSGTYTPNMEDSNAFFEVWLRDDNAMLCETRYTRTGVRMSCLPLAQVQ